MPLPPYIDARRARRPIASATRASSPASPARWPRPPPACTSMPQLVARLDALGVARAQVTLHVGAGTFQPLRVDDVSRPRDARRALRGAAVAGAMRCSDCRAAGGRVVAVGTTVARALESAAAGGELAAGRGDTRLFITPGYAFRVVDALLTNFHLPESTLLMLVSAFAGREAVLAAYAHAVREQLPVLQLRRRDVHHAAPGRARMIALRTAGDRGRGAPRPAHAAIAASSRRRPSCRWAPTAPSRP